MTGNGGKREGVTSRRTVLRIATAAGALAGIGGLVSGQPTEIALDGEVEGWTGRSPPAIAGQTNPTLSLEPGRTYRVTWTNVDGAPHNFAIADADGNRPVSTEIVDEEGATQSVEFEATPAMAEYRCEVHPGTMRGQVAVGGEETADGTQETTEGDGTETTEGPPPVLDETTIVLGGVATHWLGLAPAPFRGRENPLLRLRAGTEYELVWINLDGVEHDFHLTDGDRDLADTSDRDDVGETHDTSFEATAEMAEYYCAFHPQSMRGSVEVV
jgi:plastocyanin